MTEFKRREGARLQFQANIDTPIGEIKVNQETWMYNKNVHKGGWLQKEKVTDWNKVIQDYKFGNGHFWLQGEAGDDVTYNKEKGIIKSVKFNVADINSSDAKKRKAAEVKLKLMIKRFRAHLHYNGIINAEKGDSLYYINDKKDSEGNIITPGDTIVFRHTDRRYVGYMLAIRVPLQNYNSTPVVKVTGFTDHEAFEANAYMYGMMGADNDGDTAGLVALSKEQLEALAPTNSVEYERLKQKFGRELTRRI